MNEFEDNEKFVLAMKDKTISDLAFECGELEVQRDNARREIDCLKAWLNREKTRWGKAYEVIEESIDPIEQAINDLEYWGGDTRGLLDALERLQTV